MLPGSKCVKYVYSFIAHTFVIRVCKTRTYSIPMCSDGVLDKLLTLVLFNGKLRTQASSLSFLYHCIDVQKCFDYAMSSALKTKTQVFLSCYFIVSSLLFRFILTMSVNCT